MRKVVKEREQHILSLLREKGKVSVLDLQDELGVSDMTVRRCLNVLAERGLARRVHGGAVLMPPLAPPLSDLPAPRAFVGGDAAGAAEEGGSGKLIAALAAESLTLISPDSSIFLDGSPVCFSIARQLRPTRKCMVVTDNIRVCRELRGRPVVETLLLGGQLSVDGNTLEGPLAAENASKMVVSICFFSAAAFNFSCLENAGVSGMLTKRAVMQKARKSVCVCESCKLGQSRFIRFCDWAEVDCLITDSRLPAEAREAIAAQGVAIRLVDV